MRQFRSFNISASPSLDPLTDMEPTEVSVPSEYGESWSDPDPEDDPDECPSPPVRWSWEDYWYGTAPEWEWRWRLGLGDVVVDEPEWPPPALLELEEEMRRDVGGQPPSDEEQEGLDAYLRDLEESVPAFGMSDVFFPM